MHQSFNSTSKQNLAATLGIITALGSVSQGLAELISLGPINRDFEEITETFQPAGWFSGQNADGFVNAITGSGFGGSGGVGIGTSNSSGIADLRSQGIDVAGYPTVDFSFDYRFLPTETGAPEPGGSMRMDLRFWDAPGAAGNFLGEFNVSLGVNSSNTSVEFTTFIQNDIPVPAGAVSADIRLSANIFIQGFQGWSNFDNFNVAAVPIPALSLTASEVIVRNGEMTFLDWTTEGLGAVSLMPEPGAVDASGSADVEPPAGTDTLYTLSGTNSEGAEVMTSVILRAVQGGSATFRYIRFTPTALRGGPQTDAIQLSEIAFVSGVTEIPPIAVTNPGGSNPPDQDPSKVADFNVGTKWLDYNKSPLIFDFGAPITFDKYAFATGDDAPARDPVRWIIEGSDDQSTWTLIENVTAFDYNTPLLRNSYISSDIPLPGPSLTPLAELIGDSPKLIEGEPLVLSWNTRAAATVMIDQGIGSVAASGSLVVFPTEDATYTLTATSSAGALTMATFNVELASPASKAIAYENFNNAGEELALLEDAAIVNDFANISEPANASRLRLNPDQAGKSGVAWFRKRMNLNRGFQTSFDMHFITFGPNSGADGMAFIVQNSAQGSGAIPTGAHEDGLASNALNIKFDSYDNGEDDPSAAFVQVRAGTEILATANLLDFPTLLPLPGNDSLDLTANSGSASPYLVRVEYLPGSLNVFFNNVTVIKALDIDLLDIGAVDADGNAFVGFAARTGGDFESHDITRWFLNEGPPRAALLLKNFGFNFAANELQLTWASEVGKSYRVTGSTDMANWPNLLKSGIPGASGAQETSTTVTLPEGPLGLFRVEEE